MRSMKNKENMNRFTALFMPRDIWLAVKVASLKENKTVSQWLTDAAKEKLEIIKFTTGFSEEMINQIKNGQLNKKTNKPVLTNYQVGESKND